MEYIKTNFVQLSFFIKRNGFIKLNFNKKKKTRKKPSQEFIMNEKKAYLFNSD